jgi:hypothetical protein
MSTTGFHFRESMQINFTCDHKTAIKGIRNVIGGTLKGRYKSTHEECQGWQPLLPSVYKKERVSKNIIQNVICNSPHHLGLLLTVVVTSLCSFTVAYIA